jgi:hypothetical protein
LLLTAITALIILSFFHVLRFFGLFATINSFKGKENIEEETKKYRVNICAVSETKENRRNSDKFTRLFIHKY